MLSERNGGKQYLGITPPISMDPPTSEDEKRTSSLLKTLKGFGLFESAEEKRTREIVLGKLNGLLKEFVYKTSLAKKLPESIAQEAGGKLFTFGSYRLGVHGAGADIDTLCIIPKHISREDFFTRFYEMLKDRTEVTKLIGIPDAFVPIIKLEFSGIPIDLLCAQLLLPCIPDDLDLSDNNLLKGLDDASIRSINGTRVADQILRLVPNPEAFRLALRCIKLWAKRRAIYSTSMGFLGGIAWAILVARICQLYPNADASGIILRFFRIYYRWEWPKPILLKSIETGTLRSWNPRDNISDRMHLMPIITPAYPCMCSTHNVVRSNRDIISSEFKRAQDIVDSVVLPTYQWEKLFEKDDFYRKYHHYLQVIASAGSEEQQLKWSEYMESRMRFLVSDLERVDQVQLSHLFVENWSKSWHSVPKKGAERIKLGVFSPLDASQEVNEDDQDLEDVFVTVFHIGLKIDRSQKKIVLSDQVSAFVKKVKNWQQFDESGMGLFVQHIRRSNLQSEIVGNREKSLEDKQAKNKRTSDVLDNSLQSPDPSLKKVRSEPLSVANSSATDNGIAEPQLKD